LYIGVKLLNVLIVGYGKVGKMKSKIWASLGAKVYVLDNDSSKEPLILKDNFKLYSPTTKFTGLLDISTPADSHFNSLRQCLRDPNISPTYILVEKPLASTRKELASFVKLFENLKIRKKLYMNESYYVSTAIKQLLHTINQGRETITSVSIDLSKNRLADRDKGRFFDEELGAIGIEVPHMLAMLDMLDIDISILKEAETKIFLKGQRKDNQTFKLQHSGKISVSLTSSLGNFRIEDIRYIEGNTMARKLSVLTDKNEYKIQFDPVLNSPKLHSVITSSETKPSHNTVLLDDHLKNYLQLFMKGNTESIEKLTGAVNAIRLTETLFDLNENCCFIKDPDAHCTDNIKEGE
jgi:predicted dehydrogenase